MIPFPSQSRPGLRQISSRSEIPLTLQSSGQPPSGGSPGNSGSWNWGSQKSGTPLELQSVPSTWQLSIRPSPSQSRPGVSRIWHQSTRPFRSQSGQIPSRSGTPSPLQSLHSIGGTPGGWTGGIGSRSRIHFSNPPLSSCGAAPAECRATAAITPPRTHHHHAHTREIEDCIQGVDSHVQCHEGAPLSNLNTARSTCGRHDLGIHARRYDRRGGS